MNIQADDPKHKLNQAFGGKGFWHQDEIYQYKPESYVGTGTLASLLAWICPKMRFQDELKMGRGKFQCRGSVRPVMDGCFTPTLDTGQRPSRIQ